MVCILLVEDEASILDLEREILKGANFEVIGAKSGNDALRILETLKPDLILVDIMMPEMSGADLTERIRNNPATKDLKVIFVTALGLSESGRAKMRSLGVIDYIEKPFNVEDFMRRVKKALARQ
jgi:DNA-binding response OmpR family regulator